VTDGKPDCSLGQPTEKVFFILFYLFFNQLNIKKSKKSKNQKINNNKNH